MFRLGKAWVLAFLKKPFSPKKNASTISETAVVAKTKPTSLKTDDVYVRNTSAIFETNVVTKRITPAKRKSKLCCLKLCALLFPFVQYCSNHTI